ncbi:hypothetical protein J437_LFUL001326 [Ladona fulva]|uniref:Ubiquitin-like domain-containing protein n=1 Tax=Ladona fulva TaxID=123851 RepID=A0A8K0JTE3_LADFU|nr:hypothetical protein J437_LFUL001326 [Ladona fulva]
MKNFILLFISLLYMLSFPFEYSPYFLGSLADWMEEAVSKAEILRLIYQGRFLHSNVTLGALGLPPGKTTVMHLVPRENLPEPNSQDLQKLLARSETEKQGWRQQLLFCFMLHIVMAMAPKGLLDPLTTCPISPHHLPSPSAQSSNKSRRKMPCRGGTMGQYEVVPQR